jgi:hypothetical protein
MGEAYRARAGSSSGAAHFSVSTTGSLVYIPGPLSSATTQRDLALLDREGTLEPLSLQAGPYEVPRISPNGKQMAFGTDSDKETVIWVYDLSGKVSMRRLTFGGRNRFPIWSRDSRRIAFQSDRDGDLGIFWQRADGTGTIECLTKADPGDLPYSRIMVAFQRPVPVHRDKGFEYHDVDVLGAGAKGGALRSGGIAAAPHPRVFARRTMGGIHVDRNT